MPIHRRSLIGAAAGLPLAASKGAWDYYKELAVIPADQAFRPLDKDGCSLVKT